MKKLPSLKSGFTTGAASAAAAKAAVIYKLESKRTQNIEVNLPFNKSINIPVEYTVNRAFVFKDGGDDPDVTKGAIICVSADILENRTDILITGGKGVGIVTKKGLQVDVGNYAINPVPMDMIKRNIKPLLKDSIGVSIKIEIVDGEKIAKKTFNEKLGIMGGLSILGTTGIVIPMSLDAIKKTIACEIDVCVSEGIDYFYIVPGKIGEKFVFNLNREGYSVQVSNFFDFAICYIREKGIKKIALAGHPGKLAKIAMGFYDTHSTKSKQAQDYIASRFNLESKFNTVEEILLAGYNFDIIAGDISKRIYMDYNIQADVFLCNMKGELAGKFLF